MSMFNLCVSDVATGRGTETAGDLMTIGELSRRTGMSVKKIREYEALGLIYSAGRSSGNYRLFDESALWCAQVIRNLRSLGLTLKEIQELAAVYASKPDEPIGPRLAAVLERAEQRIEERVSELASIRTRIGDFRAEHAAALAGSPEAGLGAKDPRRARKSA
jgi:MerR family copper efflux transcriptional regulator